MSSGHRPGAHALAFLVGVAALAGAASAQIDIVTERYDMSRLGANLQETALTTSNVNVATFGKQWAYTVSGSVYAQPLYVRDVTIPGQGTHNVLYVVTMNDIVYAFDADSAVDAPLLSFDLTSEVPGSTPVNIIDIVGDIRDNIIGNVGIESTPYIDLASNTMYLVARTRESGATCAPSDPTFCQRLHALDITTLQEKPGSPVLLGGSVPGTGSGSSGGTVTFDPKIQNQRSGLAMSNGRLFVAWSSHDDWFSYHGWVMVYDTTTLQQTAIWASTPNGDEGGIWMAGRAPAIDATGNVYYMTGNGAYDDTANNYGESFVTFGPTPDTPLLDWFTPSVFGQLNSFDLDLGGSGPILIPGTDLIIGGGKRGVVYLTHTSNMGHEANIDLTVQSFQNGTGGQIKGGPVYWNRAGGVGPWMYVWSDQQNRMYAYHFNANALPEPMFDTAPASQSTLFSRGGSAGGVLTLSANGSAPGSGIVWASMAYSGTDPNSGVHPGVLRALDADNLSSELWNSEQDSARDSMGNWPKFSPPTVVNGRVYMASFPLDGAGNAPLNVYGLLSPDFTLAATPQNPAATPGGSVSYTVTTGAVNGFPDPVHLSVDGLPANSTAAFADNDFATPGSTTLTVQTAAGTPLGEDLLTITGVSGTLSHTANVGLLVTDTTPGTGAISIDFVGTGTPMAASETAGVVPRSNWNMAAGANGSGLALADETGAATGATLTWSATSVWSLGIADNPGDARMMKGYLDTLATNATVSAVGPPDTTSMCMPMATTAPARAPAAIN